MKILISQNPSVKLKKLFWEIFFVSKDRGLSLENHFPWMEKKSDDVVYFEIKRTSETIGGLVLGSKKYKINGVDTKIGIIGLVCIAPEYRGVGISGELLKKTINYAKENDYDHLTLWTSQHHVYHRHMFYVSDPWLYGWVQTDACIGRLNYKNLVNQLIIRNGVSPMPPFAISRHEYCFGKSSFTLLKDKVGEIVVAYGGDAEALGLLMIHALPSRWRLNVIEHDPLIAVLVAHGANIKLSAVNIQMWLDLKPMNNRGSIATQVIIPVLDRI